MKTSVLTVLMLTSLLSARPQAGAGSIEGTVVRLGTADPIAGVHIEMRRVEGTAASPLLPPVFAGGYFSPGATVLPNAPNPADASYATTGSDGAFRFTNLKPGKYRLLAAHPEGTYYPAEYGQRNPRGPGYDFSIDSSSSMKVRLEMAPMASVSGHVTGADGKPATHIHVLAAEIAYPNGARALNQIQGVETDDRGNYRLFWLPPGKYIIGAFPEGIRRRQVAVPFGPPAAADSMNQSFSQALIHYRTGSDGQLIREVYDVVYSPGVTNADAANVVDLRLGSNVAGIDIALAPGRRRAARIRGIVVDGTSGKPSANSTVRVTPRVNGPVSVRPNAITNENGAFEIDGIGEGEYFINATLGERLSIQTAVQALTIDSADIEGLNLIVTPGGSIPGRITLDGADANGYQVGLIRDNSQIPGPTYSVSSPTGEFSIARVHAGTYRVDVLPPVTETNAKAFVKSIRFAGVESRSGILQIGDSPSGTLDITLSNNGGIAEGQVNDGKRQPAPNAMVVVVPVDSQRPDLFKSARTDLTGQYRIPGIAPGTYLVFAWPWIQNGLWQNQDFLRTVEARGTRVTVSEGSDSNLELTLLPEVNF
jgi:protocatechuate 3,4-dioxygenase beta subunit